MATVGVIGEGAWGTAIAQVLADNGHQVLLWCHDPQVAHTIQERRSNDRYLPGLGIHTTVQPVTALADSMQASVVFVSTPVKFLRSVLLNMQPHMTPDTLLVMLCKGIENDTLLLPTAVVHDVLGLVKVAVLAGPSFARELVNKALTAVHVAAAEDTYVQRVRDLLVNDYFYLYATTDVIGVQIGGALKNAIAIGMGMAAGAQLPHNTRALILQGALEEMVYVGLQHGAQAHTIYGLSGVGDTVLTSTSSLSKNFQVGYLRGQGAALDEIIQQTGYIPEGINTLQTIKQLVARNKWQLPILEGIYDSMYQGTPMVEVVRIAMKKPFVHGASIRGQEVP